MISAKLYYLLFVVRQMHSKVRLFWGYSLTNFSYIALTIIFYWFVGLRNRLLGDADYRQRAQQFAHDTVLCLIERNRCVHTPDHSAHRRAPQRRSRHRPYIRRSRGYGRWAPQRSSHPMPVHAQLVFYEVVSSHCTGMTRELIGLKTVAIFMSSTWHLFIKISGDTLRIISFMSVYIGCAPISKLFLG